MRSNFFFNFFLRKESKSVEETRKWKEIFRAKPPWTRGAGLPVEVDEFSDGNHEG